VRAGSKSGRALCEPGEDARAQAVMRKAERAGSPEVVVGAAVVLRLEEKHLVREGKRVSVGQSGENGLRAARGSTCGMAG